MEEGTIEGEEEEEVEERTIEGVEEASRIIITREVIITNMGGRMNEDVEVSVWLGLKTDCKDDVF